jgi:membrane protein YqaA with SNARE-associated domain
MHLIAASPFTKVLWHWIQRLGGPGLIAIGLVDNSVVPFPGGMDVFTILLSMSHKELWWYYAIMATLGSILGGYLTFRMGEKGGQGTLDRRFSPNRAEKIRRAFEKGGFVSLFLGCIAPPPVPISPFLIAAGAMKYPRRKFFTAVVSGRALRYFVVAYLGSIYGRTVFGWMFRYYQPVLYVLLTLAVVGGLTALFFWRRARRRSRENKAGPRPVHNAA